MSVSKIVIMICGSLILLILIIVGGFMIRSIPDAYKSEALILVEQAKPAGAELASIF